MENECFNCFLTHPFKCRKEFDHEEDLNMRCRKIVEKTYLPLKYWEITILLKEKDM
jgi:hypothetical protein